MNHFEQDDAHSQQLMEQVKQQIRRWLDSQDNPILEVKHTPKGEREDREQHIDLWIIYRDGSRASVQVKTLRYEQLHNETLTIENSNNRNTKAPGEWEECIADHYIHGYALHDHSGFACLYLFDRAAIFEWARSQRMDIKPTFHSRADFASIEYAQIPADLIVAEPYIHPAYADLVRLSRTYFAAVQKLKHEADKAADLLARTKREAELRDMGIDVQEAPTLPNDPDEFIRQLEQGR